MRKPHRVWGDVYIVGDSEISHPYDCSVYLIASPDELVLIDAGAGESFDEIVENVRFLGFDPEKIAAVVATHCHLDHIGSLHEFRRDFGSRIIAHELDAHAIETGDGTGAEFYGVDYHPCPVDQKISQSETSLCFGGNELKVIHIPGHTPGGLAVYADMGRRVLFGQDVHGPYFLPGSDKAQAAFSLQRMIDLEADILCEGHFGIFEPASQVRRYIEGYLLTLYV